MFLPDSRFYISLEKKNYFNWQLLPSRVDDALSTISFRAPPSPCLHWAHFLSTHWSTLPIFPWASLAQDSCFVHHTHRHSRSSALSGTASATSEIRFWLQMPCTVNKTPFPLPFSWHCLAAGNSQKGSREEQSIASLNRRCHWQGGSSQPPQWTTGLWLRHPREPDWSACSRCMQTSYLPSLSLLLHSLTEWRALGKESGAPVCESLKGINDSWLFSLNSDSLIN